MREKADAIVRWPFQKPRKTTNIPEFSDFFKYRAPGRPRSSRLTHSKALEKPPNNFQVSRYHFSTRIRDFSILTTFLRLLWDHSGTTLVASRHHFHHLFAYLTPLWRFFAPKIKQTGQIRRPWSVQGSIFEPKKSAAPHRGAWRVKPVASQPDIA